MEIKFKIKGMHCSGCANLIMLTLEDLGFSEIIIDTGSGTGIAQTYLNDLLQVEKKLAEASKELPDYEIYDVKKKDQ